MGAHNFINNKFDPPTENSQDDFDVVFAMSVMTHLSQEDQKAWLKELHRILRVGGIALLSFHGPAQMTKNNDPTNHLANLFENYSVEDPTPNPDLQDLESGERYIGTSFTEAHIRRHWTEGFDVLAILDNCFGLHAVAILSKK